MHPTLRYTAVIMDKLVPSDKRPEVERAMSDLLFVFAREMQLACIQFFKPALRRDYLTEIIRAPSLEALRQTGISPSAILHRDRFGQGDHFVDIDVHQALKAAAQTFLRRIDGSLEKDSRASQAIRDLPETVGRELNIRLNTSGDIKNPVWLKRLKVAFAREMERGGWDVVTDNFGIDSKGDIIPFDM